MTEGIPNSQTRAEETGTVGCEEEIKVNKNKTKGHVACVVLCSVQLMVRMM
jgi:hypothetical protein